jgi:hypothetical protein
MNRIFLVFLFVPGRNNPASDKTWRKRPSLQGKQQKAKKNGKFPLPGFRVFKNNLTYLSSRVYSFF